MTIHNILYDNQLGPLQWLMAHGLFTTNVLQYKCARVQSTAPLITAVGRITAGVAVEVRRRH